MAIISTTRYARVLFETSSVNYGRRASILTEWKIHETHRYGISFSRSVTVVLIPPLFFSISTSLNDRAIQQLIEKKRKEIILIMNGEYMNIE